MNLPPWNGAARRAWNEALKAAGKARILTLLAPLVLELLDDVSADDIGDPNQGSRYPHPRDRATAIKALLAGDDVQFADNGAGLRQLSARRLLVASQLISAMRSEASFPSDVATCLSFLYDAAPDLVERFREQL